MPYRCIVPAKIENLLVAGRCISADFMQNLQFESLVPVWQSSEAAGTAAALCVVKHKSPRDLDANLLRQKLASQGVCLEQFVYNTPLVDEK
ncbi:FAD-dependent oxidoreductase [Mediterraneibacter gnavus]|uniref:FAD-dependent oxidoreductase n=1 Tax=Mediterraneibacter gnavus TaxID=33038 RepID=UPI0036D2D3F8